MATPSPRVSVIMTVYNMERFLRPAIDSLLEQTFSDFELIIINDGSTDGTGEILSGYSDPRMIRLDNPENMGQAHGIAKPQNKGLDIAQGQYIARQDSDDISKPERLAIELEYLESHPQVGLVGSWAELIDEENRLLGEVQSPTDSALLKWRLMFQNCFTHSSVMFRREAVDRFGYYDESMKVAAEDYELWWRISTHSPVINLPYKLVQRRITTGGIIDNNPVGLREYSARVIQRGLSHRLHETVSYEDALNMDRLMRNLPLKDAGVARHCARLILRSHRAFLQDEPLTNAERAQVTRDAAEKLYILAGKSRALNFRLALKITLMAERLAPRLPSLATLTSTLARA